MMFRRILLSTGAGASLVLAACESTTQPRPECDEVFNTVAETRGDTVVLSSGLRYIETQLGDGATVVSCRGAAVSVTGTLLDETRFQAPLGITFTPGLGQLIPGVDHGVIGLRVGGKRRLIIPPALGYGSQAQTDNTGKVIIPANSTIVFDVEALAVEP